MNTKRLFLFIIPLLMFSAAPVQAQNVRQARKLVRQGNRLFHAEKLEDANVKYRKALEADSNNTVAIYNLSRSMFPQEWLNVKALNADARKVMLDGFLKAAEKETDPERQAMSFYNAGVMLQRSGELQLAIDAYKEALRRNPADDEARYNLVICKKQMKDQPQDQQQQQQQQDQDQQQQQQQEEQKKEQPQNNDNQQDQQQQQQQPPMSKENAEQLLNNVKREENQTQKQMRQMESSPRQRNEKYW